MATTRTPKKKPAARETPRARTAREASTLWGRHGRDVAVIGAWLLGLFLALSEAGVLGPVGHGIEVGLSSTLGLARVALPVLMFIIGVGLLRGTIEAERLRYVIGTVLAVVAVSGLAYFRTPYTALSSPTHALARSGGWLGVGVGGGLRHGLGVAGAVILLAVLLLIALLVLTGVTLRSLLARVGTALSTGSQRRLERREQRVQRDVARALAREAEQESLRSAAPSPVASFDSYDDIDHVDEIDVDPYESTDVSNNASAQVFDAYEDERVENADSPFDYEDAPTASMPLETSSRVSSDSLLASGSASSWELPSSNVLQRTREQKQDRLAAEGAGEDLVAALRAHGVETTLVGYTVGPTVTRFELELGAGVKVARVTSLHKDIAYAMASPDVRILAPIPGRSAIGVEVPNRNRSLVALGDLLASEESLASHHPLDVPLGRDISGKTVMINLGAMPHVLISGATGAGKSSSINSLITSLIMRATPNDLRLILIDPKRVELGQYNSLPHLLSPVVVDPKKAATTLNWAVREMERRYDILSQYGVRDITSYQELLARGSLHAPLSTPELVAEVFSDVEGFDTEVTPSGPESLPYIVIVVDELNDLMMVAARDVEESVVRIAQMARAVGIHLVLATQRPSVDVITGVIKANIPSRMAFAVSSLADSRVILDQAGAERLIGRGDMLLLTASSNIARRLQAPWVSEDEVRSVVTAWARQGGRTESVIAVDTLFDNHVHASAGALDDDSVALNEARRLVIANQSGSTSMLQRKMRIGFARAGRLMDMLEEEGIVGPGDGSKARKVNVTVEQYEQQQASL